MKTASKTIEIRLHRTWNFNPCSRIHDGRGKTGKGYNRSQSKNWKRDQE